MQRLIKYQKNKKKLVGLGKNFFTDIFLNVFSRKTAKNFVEMFLSCYLQNINKIIKIIRNIKKIKKKI